MTQVWGGPGMPAWWGAAFLVSRVPSGGPAPRPSGVEKAVGMDPHCLPERSPGNKDLSRGGQGATGHTQGGLCSTSEGSSQL